MLKETTKIQVKMKFGLLYVQQLSLWVLRLAQKARVVVTIYIPHVPIPTHTELGVDLDIATNTD